MLKTNNKKFLSLFLAIVFLFGGLGSTGFSESTHNDRLQDDKITSDVLISKNAERAQFELRTPTLKDDFKDDIVIVVLRKGYSEVNAVHETRTFNDFAVKTYDELEKQNAVKSSSDSRSLNRATFSAVEDLMYAEDYEKREEIFNMEHFRQILSFKLDKPGKENVLAAIEVLEKHESVLFAQPCYNYKTVSNFAPNDTRYHEQWALPQINIQGAWGITTGRKKIRVGVFESGVHANHEDLRGNIFAANFTPFTPYISDYTHGTKVMGVIGAVRNNGKGISGVAQVDMALLNNQTTPDFVNSIKWAANNGIRIINASYHEAVGWPGTPAPPDASHHAAIAGYNGLFISTAGNKGLDTDINSNKQYPAGYNLPNMIVVGASDQYDNRGIWSNDFSSNYGTTSVHLFAPGVGILLTCGYSHRHMICPTGYCSDSGTSFAAPHVAGVAALLWSEYPYATYEQIKQAILDGVDKVPALTGLCSTGGRLNAHKAFMSMPIFDGIYYIKNANRGLYLTGNWSPYESSTSISVGELDDYDNYHNDYQRWVIQKSGNHYQLRICALNGNSVGNAIVSATPTNVTISRNSNGTVTFKLANTNSTLTATRNSTYDYGVSWLTTSGYNTWILEPHPLSYRKGDINQDGVINITDYNELAKYFSGLPSKVDTAVGYYLADTNRDGTVGSTDITEILNYIGGQPCWIG